MNISRALILAITLTAPFASGQTAPKDRLKSLPPAAAAQASPELAAIANVNLVKGADGSWKCMGAAGKVCTSQEAQAYTGVTRSRSNVKDNLVISPDGGVHCTNAVDGKPCSDTTIQTIATQMKAISQGGKLEK